MKTHERIMLKQILEQTKQRHVYECKLTFVFLYNLPFHCFFFLRAMIDLFLSGNPFLNVHFVSSTLKKKQVLYKNKLIMVCQLSSL